VPGVSVAGKTGTAQIIRLEHFDGVKESKVPIKYRDHAWFVAFAPAEDAEIVVAVISEHGGHGGSAAAPLAQKVLAKYFEKKGVVPPPKAFVTGHAPREEEEDPLIEDVPDPTAGAVAPPERAPAPEAASGGSDGRD
jgi:penicillin-binding protein 2